MENLAEDRRERYIHKEITTADHKETNELTVMLFINSGNWNSNNFNWLLN